MAQASKITPTGTLYTAGSIDEVTYNSRSGIKTNLISWSQDFTQSFWSKAANLTVTGGQPAPDGTNTAALFTSAGGANDVGWVDTGGGNLSFTKNNSYTFSVYARAGTQSTFYILLYGPYYANTSTTNVVAGFDLAAGTASNQGNGTINAVGIQNIGNGWYRCWMNATAQLTGTGQSNQLIRMGSNTGNAYFWGFQVEQSTGAPSIYVPTDGTFTPAPTFVSRTNSVGNTYITNTFDEVTYNPASGVQKNLLSGSNTFTNGVYWTVQNAPTLTPNSFVAPDGTPTAWKYNLNAPSGRGVVQTLVGAIANQTYTFSIWVNAIQNTSFYFVIIINGVTTFVSTQAITVAQGWQRLYYTFTPPSVTGGVQVQFQDVSGNIGDMFYVWGAQVELGTTPTIYEPTGANAVPVPTFAQRTEFTGNVYVSGNYDEVSQPLNPVTDSSLIMHLDPAMTNSYPGTGTTWYDLSGYGNHATFLTGAIPTGIQKAPGYSTDYGGIIVLNGGQQNVANMPGANVWANTAIKTSTFTPQMDRTFSIWVRFHNTTNSLAWMNPVSYGITGTTSSYTYGTGSAPTPPIVSNPLIASNPSGYTRTYGAQGILLGCNYYGDYGLSWYSLIYNAQNNFQIQSENRINSPSYVDYSPSYSYISNPPAVNPFYGTWHNIVGTYSYSTNYQAIYVDGVAMNTSTTSAFAGLTYPMTFPSLMIGYAGEAGGNSTYAYLDGDVGQCLVYKRALSAAEVLQNFTTYRARYGV